MKYLNWVNDIHSRALTVYFDQISQIALWSLTPCQANITLTQKPVDLFAL